MKFPKLFMKFSMENIMLVHSIQFPANQLVINLADRTTDRRVVGGQSNATAGQDRIGSHRDRARFSDHPAAEIRGSQQEQNKDDFPMTDCDLL